MRTICPFCNQKYDVGNEWLGHQTACPQCSKEFIIEEAVQCRSCGVYNNASDKKCRGCQATIFRLNIPNLSQADLPPVKIKPPVKEEKKQFTKRYSSADAIYGWDKTKMTLWAAPGGVLLLGCIVYLLVSFIYPEMRNDFPRWGYCIFGYLGILGIWSIKFVSDLQNSYKKFRFTLLDRILFWLYLPFLLLPIGTLIGLILTAITICAAPDIWQLARARDAEDADVTQEELNRKRRYDIMHGFTTSAVAGVITRFTLVGLLPFIGFLFLLLAAVLNLSDSIKGYPSAKKSWLFIALSFIFQSLISLYIYNVW